MIKVLKLLLCLFLVSVGVSCSNDSSDEYVFKLDFNNCGVGDYVLKDGTVLSRNVTLTPSQKENVAAIIVRPKNGNTPALGMGIKFSELISWCCEEAIGYNTLLTGLIANSFNGYSDGRNSWEVIKECCKVTVDDSSKYPAFDYCLKYGHQNDLTNMNDGWYLPTLAEHKIVYSNKKIINESLLKAGGCIFSDEKNDRYWSCNQNSTKTYEQDENKKNAWAWEFDFIDGSADNTPKDDNTVSKVYCIRVFSK